MRLPQYRIQPHRRGITAVLAMLYMVLFSTLALGFYASVTTAVQVAGNQQRTSRALAASEGGMNFMKYHLANLGIPAGTSQDQLFQTVHDCLASRLEGYPVMNVNVYDATTGTYSQTAARVGMPDSDTITIPDRGDGIRLDNSGTNFKVIIKKLQNGEKLEVSVLGNANGTSATTHGTQLEYSVAQDAAKIFNFGVASKSAINLSGHVSIQGIAGNPAMGSVLSASSSGTPIYIGGSSSISGDVSFTQSSGVIQYGPGATVAGVSVPEAMATGHVHAGADNVDFPLVITDAFAKYVASDTTTPDGITVIDGDHPPVGTSFKNIRIKGGSKTVSFASDTTIQGVIYLEEGAHVSFAGGANITGVIVSETPDPTNDPNNGLWDPASNTLDFAGNVTFAGVSHLPDTPDFPQELRDLTGSMILVPGYTVSFGGNFGSVDGSIIASQMSFTGNAGGTVLGSVVNLNDSALTMGGTGDIIIKSLGTSNYPAGVYFGSHYSPLPATYAEIIQ